MATPRKKEYVLDENQKQLILDNFNKGVTDVNLLTKVVCGNDKKDGRDIEGIAVRKFLVASKLNYKTKHNAPAGPDVSLTEENKELIRKGMTENKTTVAMAREIFGPQVNNLSKEWRTVLAFMREENPDYRPDSPNDAGKYYAPKETNRIVARVNEATGLSIDPEHVSGKHKQFIDKLRVNMNSMRFVRVCDNYLNIKDRDLFIEEFVKLTWDKPDLTADELNLYINVCKDIVNGEVLSGHIATLNQVFDSMGENQEEFTVKFSEMLSAKVNEYQQNQKRVADTIKKLQGDRADRLKSKSSGALSLIGLLEEFQDERTRRHMIDMGRRQKLIRVKEGERLESISEMKARVLGFSIEDVV